MKIKKFGAIAAAALVVTSLAMSASASSLPNRAANDVGIASVKAVDVDLSTIDWANIQEGEFAVVGTIDPATVNGGTTTAGKAESSEAVVYAVEAAVDLSVIDWANIQEGELEAIGTIDPATVNGGFTTQSASK